MIEHTVEVQTLPMDKDVFLEKVEAIGHTLSQWEWTFTILEGRMVRNGLYLDGSHRIIFRGPHRPEPLEYLLTSLKDFPLAQ